MTNDQMREAFEARFPMPPQCVWTGRGYAATGYNAWDAHAYCKRWDGFVAGYAAGMERAAGICDQNSEQWDTAANGTAAYAAGRCADTIRAEIPKEGV